MDYTKDITNRLKRVEGQVRGVLRMMDGKEDCQAVTTQLSAIRSAVDRTIAIIVSKNLERCLIEDIHEGKDTADSVNEAIKLLVRSK